MCVVYEEEEGDGRDGESSGMLSRAALRLVFTAGQSHRLNRGSVNPRKLEMSLALVAALSYCFALQIILTSSSTYILLRLFVPIFF